MYHLKHDYNIARNKHGKTVYADPLTNNEAALVPKGFHVGNPYQDPTLRTESSALRDTALFTKRDCYTGTSRYTGTLALNEEQLTPAKLHYKDAMELHLEPYIKGVYDFDVKFYDWKLLLNQLFLCNYGRKDLKDMGDQEELNIQNSLYATERIDELKVLPQVATPTA